MSALVRTLATFHINGYDIEDVHHLIRFHFAKRDDTLNAALDRLSELDRKAKDYLR